MRILALAAATLLTTSAYGQSNVIIDGYPFGSTPFYVISPVEVSSVPQLGPETEDGGNHIILSGDSLSVGSSGGAAISTSSLYAGNTRSQSELPFPPIVEGTGTGGSGSDIEQPLTAGLDQIRSMSSLRHFIGTTRGVAGATIETISTPNTVYDNVISAVTSAQSAKAGGDEPHRVVALWTTTGHNDHHVGDCSTFAADLEAWRAQYQSALYAITGQSAPNPLPAFISQFSSWSSGASASERSDCADAILSLPTLYPGRWFVVGPRYHFGDEATLLYVDGAHLTNVGYQLLSEYQGMATKAVLVDGIDWKPLQPSALTASGSTILIDYSVPCQALSSCDASPLAFDTTNVQQAFYGGHPNVELHGFEIEGGGPSPPVISSVGVSGSRVTLTMDKTVPTGMTVHYADRAISAALAGNGFAGTNGGSARGNLRDTNQIAGARSTQNLYNWAVSGSWAVSGGAAQASSVASVLDDRRWSWMWAVSSANCPAAGANLPGVIGGQDIPWDNGTWSCGQDTGSLNAAAIGATRVDNALTNTSGCWRTATGISTFDSNEEDGDFLIRFVGRFTRPGATQTLAWWRGDTATGNEWAVSLLSTGNIQLLFSTDGADVNAQIIGAVPEGTTDGIIDVWVDRERALSGNIGGRAVICAFGTCDQIGGATTPIGGQATGRLALMSAHNCSQDATQTIVGIGWAQGATARWWTPEIHVSDHAAAVAE